MQNHAKVLIKVSTVTIIVNVLLFVLKLVIGLIFSNLAVFSDAIHSAADVLTSVTIIIVSFFISAKPDKKHNYGHERIEPLFTLILSFLVGLVSVILAWEGIQGLLHPTAPEVSIYLIVTVIISLLMKEGMFWYGIYNAKKIKSEMLRVTAWHNRSDSLSSLAVLISLLCSKFTNNNIFESIAVIIVALLIIKVAVEIFITATNQLIDRAASEATCEKIKALTNTVAGVKNIDQLRTRLFASRVYVDLDIAVDEKLTVAQGNEIATKVQDKLVAEPELEIKACMIHVNPYHK